TNLTRYVGNSPTNAIDPNGLATCDTVYSSPGLVWVNPNTNRPVNVPLTGLGVYLPPTVHGGTEPDWDYYFEHSPSAQLSLKIGLGALTLAGGVVVYEAVAETTVFLEGSLVGEESGGLFQIRPDGAKPWIRFDYHPLGAGGPNMPHIDSPLLGWHHW